MGQLTSSIHGEGRAKNRMTIVLKMEASAIVTEPSSCSCREELSELSELVQDEAGAVMRRALLAKADREPAYKLPRMANLSVVLCGDMHIRALNLQHRNKDAPTDVLSFEMEDELDYKVGITDHADQHPAPQFYTQQPTCSPSPSSSSVHTCSCTLLRCTCP